MPEIPVFVNHGGVPTDEGKVLLAYFEAQIESAGRNAAKLNALPGPVKHFIAMTAGTMTPAEWLEENRFGYANLAYDTAMALQEATQHQEQTNDLAGQLAKLSEALQEANARIKALESAAPVEAETAEVEAPAPVAPKVKKAKATTTPEEAPDEDEPEADAEETTDEE